MKFCSNYGQSVILHIPVGDNRLRDVCGHYNTIHYVNSRNVVGTVPAWNNRILLCEHTIEPCYGFWTLSAGLMEIGETTAQAANQETVEETGASVEIGELYSVLNVPHVHQVHLFYLAKLNDLDFALGEESLEVAFFNEADIPWDDLAFPTIIRTLCCFFIDCAAGKLAGGSFRFYMLDIYKLTRFAAIDTPVATP